MVTALERERLPGVLMPPLLECKLGKLPIKSLGLPLLKGRIKKEDWGNIIRRIEGRIEGWQAKLLSQGECFILVNSVLSNLPLYFLSIFRAPKWVIRRIDSLWKTFFWRRRSCCTGGLCLVN